MGHNVRNVARSARYAGYEVYAVTQYKDADLKLYAKVLDVKIDPKAIESVAEEIGAFIVLCSGCEDLPVDYVLGTSPKVAKEIVDKLKFYRRLERAGIPFPDLTDEEPSILKPRRGGGGLGIRWFDGRVPDGYVRQRFVPGIPCSVSLLAGDGWIVPVAVNEMLVGWEEMFAPTEFTYVGNVTPKSVEKEIVDLAVEVCELFDVLGSVGVDFIVADEPYVLELNPRFQGSLDSVEWSLDVNMFELHVSAVEGRRMDVPKPKRFACRAVMFSPDRLSVKEELRGNPFYADVPNPGESFDKGEPVVSILSTGKSRSEVISKVLRRRDLFLKLQTGSRRALRCPRRNRTGRSPI